MKKRKLRKRSLGRKVRRYFSNVSRYLHDLKLIIDFTINDFKYHLKRELTLQSIKERSSNGIIYLKEKASDFSDNMSCLRTRLEVYGSMKKQNNKKYPHQIIKRAVDSLDDCFDTMSEPLYGFRTKISTEKNCEIEGANCDVSNATKNKSAFQKRQTGEEFRSDAPPDCRTINECK